MLQQLPEGLHPVVLPVVDSHYEVFEGFVKKVTVNSGISLGKDSLGGRDALGKVFLHLGVFGLLVQVLAYG